MVDSRDLIYVNGDPFIVTDIFREDVHAEPDSENYILEAECTECNNDGTPTWIAGFELGLTRPAAINLMASLMELLNRVGE